MKHPFTIERGGRIYHLVKHPAKHQAHKHGHITRAELLASPWYLRFENPATGKDTLQKVGEHFETAVAVEAARKLLEHTRGERNTYLKYRDAIRYKAAAHAASLETLEAAYRAAAKGRLLEATIDANIYALRNVIRRATGQDLTPAQFPVRLLDGDLVHRFKQNVIGTLAVADECMKRRKQRTANSLLAQARSLFSDEMRALYKRELSIELPDSIKTFRAEPCFNDVIKTQAEYQMPSDDVIRATFDALEKVTTTDPDIHTAIWLVLGFGLRKSEIAGVRRRNLITIGGTPYIEIEEVWSYGRAKGTTKNSAIRPRVSCSNGAWPHLKPLLDQVSPDAYLIAGTETYRTENLYRAIGQWMRDLGWTTHKAIHEFRAYAGCQVAMRDGIYAASKWLRHSSVLITEKHYGRYVKHQVSDAPLALPGGPQLKVV